MAARKPEWICHIVYVFLGIVSVVGANPEKRYDLLRSLHYILLITTVMFLFSALKLSRLLRIADVVDKSVSYYFSFLHPCWSFFTQPPLFRTQFPELVSKAVKSNLNEGDQVAGAYFRCGVFNGFTECFRNSKRRFIQFTQAGCQALSFFRTLNFLFAGKSSSQLTAPLNLLLLR